MVIEEVFATILTIVEKFGGGEHVRTCALPYYSGIAPLSFCPQAV